MIKSEKGNHNSRLKVEKYQFVSIRYGLNLYLSHVSKIQAKVHNPGHCEYNTDTLQRRETGLKYWRKEQVERGGEKTGQCENREEKKT